MTKGKVTVKKKEKIVIDITKVRDTTDGGHNVIYCVYHEKGDETKPLKDKEIRERNIRKISHVCFASLRTNVKKGDNRIMYFVQKQCMPEPLSMIKRITWIKMAVKNKLLPEYILDQNLEGDRFVIKLDDISPSLLYVYLSTIRNVQENPRFVKNVVTLVKTYKMDYVSAFVTASKFNLGNSWHSIIGEGKSYGSGTSSNINNMKNISISLIICLKRYIEDPIKHDKRKFPNGNYNASDNIRCLSRIGHGYYNCSIQQLFDPIVKKAIQASSDKKAEELLKKAGIKRSPSCTACMY